METKTLTLGIVITTCTAEWYKQSSQMHGYPILVCAKNGKVKQANFHQNLDNLV